MTQPGWLATYMRYAAFDHYPPNFHLACATSLLGLAFGRRAWTVHRRWPIYPLIHHVLFGDSGTGKNAVVEIMLRVQRGAVPTLGLIRKQTSDKGIAFGVPANESRTEQTEPCLLEAAEMTTMINKSDMNTNLIPVLTDLAEGGGLYRTYGDYKIALPYTMIAMLFGTNEQAAIEYLPGAVVSQGFAARLVWNYGESAPEPEEGRDEDDPEVEAALAGAIKSLKKLRERPAGKVPLGESARTWYRAWHRKHRNVASPDKDYGGYYNRRHLRVLRYGLLACLARGGGEITPGDLSWGWDLVVSQEAEMFKVFDILRLSNYGRVERDVHDWVVRNTGPDGYVLQSAITSRFHGRLAGAASVRKVLDNLVEAGKLVPNREGRGVRYKVASRED